MGERRSIVRGWRSRAAPVLVLVLVAAACGDDGDDTAGDSQSAEETTTVRLQALDGGMSALALKVIEQQGFDEANGFEAEFQYIAVDAAAQHFLQGESDVSFDVGPPDLAVAAAEDHDVVSFTPLMGNHVEVIVPADSEHQTMEDLQGARIGHFGDDSTATLSISLLLDQFHDTDFLTDYELVLNSPPALVELLASGEVDAIVSFEPHLARAAATIEGGTRTVYNPGEDWEEQTGGALWILAPTAMREWVESNPEAAEGVLGAACDTADYINSNPEDVATDPEFDELLGLDEPAKQDLADFLATEPFDCEWDTDQVDNANELLDLMADQGVLFQENPGDAIVPLDELVGG